MIQILLGVVVVGVLLGGVYVAQQGGSTGSESTVEVLESASQIVGADTAMMKDEMAGEMSKDEMMKDEMAGESPEGAAMKNDEMKVDGMMNDTIKDGMDDAVSAPAAAAATTPAQYVPYTDSAVATYAAQGDLVLFFRASWCPSCRALDADITKNLGSAPAGLTILDVDYDTATALRQQYGVTTQHTLVQVAADGTLIKKWSGGSTLASVVAQVE